MDKHIYAAMQINLIDCPDEITCTLFTQGCRTYCPWCHNKKLWPETEGQYNFSDVKKFIKRQRVKPGAIAFSGGEPLLHREQVIHDAEELRQQGLKTVLYTSGYTDGPISVCFPVDTFDSIILSIKGGEDFYPPGVYNSIFNSVIFMNFLDYDLTVQILESIHGKDTEKISEPFRRFSKVVN